jgi:hypothetical protein
VENISTNHNMSCGFDTGSARNKININHSISNSKLQERDISPKNVYSGSKQSTDKSPKSFQLDS